MALPYENATSGNRALYEVTYDLERTVVGSVLAGVTADRCGQCGACDRFVVSVAVGDREAGVMEMTERNKDEPTQPVGGPDALAQIDAMEGK